MVNTFSKFGLAFRAANTVMSFCSCCPSFGVVSAYAQYIIWTELFSHVVSDNSLTISFLRRSASEFHMEHEIPWPEQTWLLLSQPWEQDQIGLKSDKCGFSYLQIH